MIETLSFSSSSYSLAPGENLRGDTEGTGLLLKTGLGFLWFERQAVKQLLVFLPTWRSWKFGLIRGVSEETGWGIWKPKLVLCHFIDFQGKSDKFPA